MALLDGMEQFGLGELKNIEKDASVIEKNVASVASTKEVKAVKEETEKDFIFEKVFECPVCDNKFKQLVVKSSKARATMTDKDLKPNYRIIDPLKYDVIHCNKCGYAALLKYYGPLAKPHKEMLKNTISARFKPTADIGDTVTYGQAFARFQITLANAMCRQAKASEVALIYLKMGWLAREMQRHNEEVVAENEKYSMDNLKDIENEALQNAKDKFTEARLNETPPIAGMNDVTVDYLLAALSIRYGEYENASKLISEILTSTTANTSQKDKARDLKEELRAILLGKKQS